MTFWAYILHCRGGVFYTGHTDDLELRVAQHQSCSVPGFTSKYLPVELVWSQEFSARDEALEAERQIKGWSRKKKLALIRGDWEAIARLARSKSGPSTSSGRTEVLVSRTLHTQLFEEARSAHPLECCGILLGEGYRITTVQPALNVHPDPETHFEIDPQALIEAHRAAREGGPQVLGYYHSHPNGAAEPSATDAELAAGDGAVWAIAANGGVTFWRSEEGGFTPLSYQIVDP
ncbi:Mov34/MPN/PAD-1 family protein [Altererythrobacter sp.]|uniref:Mov34/MPN/PAD-1 family protein n=1 Tax=Altererythrobacter sp. TaxID=1872480 RepID=UPI003D06427C